MWNKDFARDLQTPISKVRRFVLETFQHILGSFLMVEWFVLVWQKSSHVSWDLCENSIDFESIIYERWRTMRKTMSIRRAVKGCDRTALYLGQSRWDGLEDCPACQADSQKFVLVVCGSLLYLSFVWLSPVKQTCLQILLGTGFWDSEGRWEIHAR